jgi:N6-L-threonylcarbamoyladenine synthase
MPCLLGIETSCDETAAALVADGKHVLSNVVASQISRHAPYGGVVPELAAREHLLALDAVAGRALTDAGLGFEAVAGVAVTIGPGLMPALLVGLNFAKGLAAANRLPLIGVNHFFAHLYGSFLERGPEALAEPATFPLVALVVSGGHTALVLVNHDGTARLIGQTLDDAAGEALDKAAKLLKLGYPGGPIIEKLAAGGRADRYRFPRPLTAGRGGKGVSSRDRFNFSFSGLKTALLYHCRDLGGADRIEGQLLYDTLASYQEAAIAVLTAKTLDAAAHFAAKTIVVCGGVACNRALRARCEQLAPDRVNLVLAPPKYCTDNAAMVAGLAWHDFQNQRFAPLNIDAYSRLPALSRVPF